ncbi:hypothetical protein PG997_010396 [Apiospora hydei]|uniref:Uncharacterized protein n=1 Tax=Apiospora hydei TaxID=1337664 RepID=A0ABR1VWV5_9PEZI
MAWFPPTKFQQLQHQDLFPEFQSRNPLGQMRPLQICIAPSEPGFLTPMRVNALHRALRHHVTDNRHPPSTPADSLSAPPSNSPALLLAFEPAPSYKVPRARDEDKVKSGLQQALQVPQLSASGARGLADSEATLKPDVLFSTHKRAVYRGPGMLALWPILDAKSPTLSKIRGEDAEKALANAAIAFLRRLYGNRGLGNVTHRPGLGLWVDSMHFREARQIADIEVFPQEPEQQGVGEQQPKEDAASDAISCRIDINLDVPVMGSSDTNPWARLDDIGPRGQDTTSVAVELSTTDKHSHGESMVTESAMKELGAAFATELGLEKPLLVGPEEAFGEDWRQMGYEEPVEDPSKRSWLADTLTLVGASAIFGFFE